jgi:deoxycitidine kinase
MSPTVFFIEGNIGTGKTTFCKQIENLHLENVQVIFEPVDEWENTKDSNGKNILQHFYNDMSKNCYLFQSNAFITRFNALKKIDSSKQFVFVERSMYSDKNVFAKTCHENNMMKDIEWTVYNKWFDTLIGNLNISHNFIYLKCSPETSLARVKKRNRSSEENITLDYLTNLHNKHDNWLVNNSYIVDASKNYLDKEIFRTTFHEMISHCAAPVSDL